jgi:hypothetical protein
MLLNLLRGPRQRVRSGHSRQTEPGKTAARAPAGWAWIFATCPAGQYPDPERIRFVRSFAQMRRAERKHALRHMPLSVISKGLPFGLPEDLPGGLTPAVLERAWRHAQDKLAKLTPDPVHVIAKRSSQYVLLTQPRLIIDQARRVVRAVRRARR